MVSFGPHRLLVVMISIRSILFLALSCCGRLAAQDTLAIVFGSVTDHDPRALLTGITIACHDKQDSTFVVEPVIREGGFYELQLMEERTYSIVFSAKGHVPKRVLIELKGPTREQWEKGFGINADISLFKTLPGVDADFGGEPFGICRFDPSTVQFEWDRTYSQGMRERHAAALKAYEAKPGKRK